MWNASLAQMGAGLGRLSNASLKIKQNRIVALNWTPDLGPLGKV